MLRKILPHLSILLCNMYIVFFLIDRVNSAMAFINNNITKWLLLVSSLISIATAIIVIRDERKRVRREEQRRAQLRASARRTQTAGSRNSAGSIR